MTADLLTGLTMAALLLAAALVATRPWWRRDAAAVQDRRAANVAAYRLRLGELETELAAGLVPPDEAANLRAELDARLLREAGEAGAEPGAVDRRRLVGSLLTGLVLAAFAAGWYLQGGSWKLQREIAKGPAPAEATVDPKIAAMVDQLAAKMKAQPDDAQGWVMLGRSYFVLQRYAESAQAYAEANARAAPPNPEWLTDEAEALAFAGDREVSGRAAELIEQALTLAPDYGKALWYGGLASAQAGDFPTARARWQQLLQDPQLPQPMRDALVERLKTIDELAANPAAGAAAPSGETNAAAVPAGPGLRVSVTLAPELAAKVPAGATLFVFAKAESGPQMPLAVQRLPNAKLPLEVTLDDSMAMAPALRMSQFERYTITARLSATGGAQAQPGDLEGRVAATRAEAGGKALELRIDRLVP